MSDLSEPIRPVSCAVFFAWVSCLPGSARRPAARIPRVLAIAGSDPSGGAGIQADLKSIAAHGGYGMAAITALTAQNTRGVSAVHVPPAAFLTAQLDAISEDITIDAVKIGDARGCRRDRRRPQLAGKGPSRRRGPGPGDGGHERRPAAAGIGRGRPARRCCRCADLDHAQSRRTRHPAPGAGRGGLGRRPWNRASGWPPWTGTTVLVAPKGGRPGSPLQDDGGADAGNDAADGCPGRAGQHRRACWARRTWWCRGSGCTRATATAPAARCPRPWPQCRPG